MNGWSDWLGGGVDGWMWVFKSDIILLFDKLLTTLSQGDVIY
jgi:hypothetical protein